MIKRVVEDFFCTEDAPVVETRAGKAHGYRTNGVYCFKGIPYARARRFHMPEPVERWDGVWDATAYGPGCPMMGYSMMGWPEMDQLEVPGRFWSVSEDCQNLNIWTREPDPARKRPVMVWLHGGGFVGGSSTHLYAYDGHEMASRYDVVLVSVNHRLNVYGFFDLSEYGDAYAHSGNAGLSDLVLALKWVRDNIAAFGGDPDNVTIYGQSGGGMKVSALMQMPEADGLYHRAIIQSGVLRWPRFPADRDMARRVVASLGLTRSTISQIETMPIEPIAKAISEEAAKLGVSMMHLFGPVPEPGYYEGQPLDVGFRRENAHVPMIVGSCVAEFDDSLPPGDKSKWSDERRMEALEKAYGDRAGAVRAAFEKAYPELDWSYAAIADNMIRPAVIDFLNLRCRTAEAPCYNYVFEFESAIRGGKLLGHNSDLHFTFHNASRMDAMFLPVTTGVIEEAVAGAWARFAQTGSPNGPKLPEWEPYAPESGACMKLGMRIGMTCGHDRELMAELARFAMKDIDE